MPNQLLNEQSLYLQQHAHNPVNWQPWSEAAFEQAEKENKPLLISIGYAACHWCHVMEHESFEDAATAAFMNEHFINIKVDREEYPDVDDFYMTAIQAMTGSGGWPLNVFVTPDKLPFYGGTYFPPQPAYGRPSWMQLLERIQGIWQERPEDIRQQADQMLQHLRQTAKMATVADDALFTAAYTEQAVRTMLQYADKTNGGFGRAPKFPSTMALGFLLEHAHFTGHQEALDHVLRSVNAMIGGGIYDQLGGGLSRYATDDHWLAPHFEKMLYDNALLVDLLCDVYQLSGNLDYKKAIADTMAFLLREMKAPDAGFYSALDADSEGEEGRYYTWTWQEWESVMTQFPAWLSQHWGIEKNGNWEHTNILHVAVPAEQIAAAYQLDVKDVKRTIEKASAYLLELRSKRVRPATDDKCLLSWNALMNASWTKASRILGREDYLQRSAQHLRWMLAAFRNEKGTWLHTWKNGQARITANLDDLAFLIKALLDMLSADGDRQWFLAAQEIMEYVMQYFESSSVYLLDFTSGLENTLPLRKPETYDGTVPSSNAVMAYNLYILGMLSERSDWIDRSEKMMLQMKPHAQLHPTSFAYWNTLIQRLVKGFRTVTVTGPEALATFRCLQNKFAPQCFYFFEKKENFVTMPFTGTKSNNTQVFICDKSSCYPPLEDIPENLDFTIF